MTTEKPTNILPKLPTEMAAEKSTKNAPKPKEDSPQIKHKPNRIMCRITERLRLRSRITITLLPRHDGNRQIDIYISHRRSNELSKGPPAGSLPRHAPRSRARSRARSLPRS